MSRVPALLLTLTCACCLLGCGRQRDSAPLSTPSSAGPATPAPTVADVAPWLADPTRPLKELEGFIAQGLSADALRRAALLHASALGADALANLWAWTALERELAPSERLPTLLRAMIEQRRAVARTPAPKLRRALLGLDRQELLRGWWAAMERGEREEASQHLRATSKKLGQEVVTELLAQWSCVSGADPEQAMAVLDLLRTTRWRDADQVLVALSRTMATVKRGARWREVRDQARQLAAMPPAKLRQINVSRRLAKTDRKLLEAVLSSASDGAHLDVLWDGVVLTATLRLLAGQITGRALRVAASLRQLSQRSPTPTTRWQLLLWAAETLESGRYVAAEAPVEATATVKLETRRGGAGVAERVQAIRRLKSGGEPAALALRDNTRALLAVKRLKDPRQLLVAMASPRVAAVSAPPLQAELLTPIALVEVDAQSPDWAGLAEVRRVCQRLRGAK